MEPRFIQDAAIFAGILAMAGLLQVGAGWLELKRFFSSHAQPLLTYPPLTVLKPLHGDEPLLEEALASFCLQNYGQMQIVFGLQDPTDPALSVVKKLIARFPSVDIEVVVSEVSHGANRKIANLMNMLPFARYDVLLVADSDMHVAPDHMRRVVETLSHTGTGLVTSLYSGLAAFPNVAGQLGAAHINHSFTPGALIGRLLGRRDCLGATMALTRHTLNKIGGFEVLVEHLADDALLGRLIDGLGLKVSLAPTMPATTVPETTVSALFAHELRWARTIRCVAPFGFALSAIQYPLMWSTLSILLSGAAVWSLGLMLTTWLLLHVTGTDIDRMFGLPRKTPVWLPPLRDFLSIAVMTASYTSTNVAWHGNTLTSRMRPSMRPVATKFAPGKG